MARACWRLTVLAVIGCSLAPSARAQLTLGTGLRASTVEARGGDRWRANQVVASAFRLDRSWLAFSTDGAVLRNDRGLWRSTGSVDASLLAPLPGGARFALVGSLGEPARDSTLHPSRFVVGARLSRRVASGGAWVAADVARPAGAPGPRTADFTSGLWRQLGSALVTVSLSSRSGTARTFVSRTVTVTLPDSVWDSLGTAVRVPRQVTKFATDTSIASLRWSEAEGRLYWAAGRWSLDVAVGGRPASTGVDAALWARADAAVLVNPRLAIVAGAGTAPGGMVSRLPAHRHASVGVRLMRAAPVARSLPVEVQPVALAFEVQPIGPGQYRVALRVPRARVVELTGDFTGWTPVALHRASGDWWETTLSITPGTHQVNVRINGERWVAPPGASVVDDDFAGVVGVIVVH